MPDVSGGGRGGRVGQALRRILLSDRQGDGDGDKDDDQVAAVKGGGLFVAVLEGQDPGLILAISRLQRVTIFGKLYCGWSIF